MKLVRMIICNHPGSCEDYIEEHGKHFTKELVEYASSLMENADGTNHTWTVDLIKQALIANNYKTEGTITQATLEDIAYLANMYYADMYPDPLTSEKEVLMAANRTAQDPDGYEGMVFWRWLADIKGKHIEIDWDEFI